MAGQGINGPFPFQTREYFDNAGDPNAAKGSTLTFEELDKTLLSLSASIANVEGGTGTPAGPNQSIQFNSGSNFSGSSNFSFDYTNNNVILTGSILMSGSSAITGVDYIDFDTTASIASSTGRLHWNDVDGTLELGLKGGVVSSELGQGLVTRIVNKTDPNTYLSGSNYQVVVVAGAQGQRLAVKLAQADNDANSAGTLGIVAENIAENQEGFVITVGLLKDRDTTGALQGETWSDGNILYLSPTTAGAITNIKPQAPQHTIIIGYVEYAHQNNGKIYVKIDNGYELDELHNVRITTASLTAGDLLIRSSSVWINSKQLTGSYGLTGSLAVSNSLNVVGTGSVSGSFIVSGSLVINPNGGVGNQLINSFLLGRTSSIYTMQTSGTFALGTGGSSGGGNGGFSYNADSFPNFVFRNPGGDAGLTIKTNIGSQAVTTQAIIFPNTTQHVGIALGGHPTAYNHLVIVSASHGSASIGIGTASPYFSSSLTVSGGVILNGTTPYFSPYTDFPLQLLAGGANKGIGLYSDIVNQFGYGSSPYYQFGSAGNATWRLATSTDQGFLIQNVQPSINTRFYVSSSGNVGIGTSTPSSNLHVFRGSSGTTGLGLPDGTLLVLENDTTNYINFRSPNANVAGLAFSSPSDTSAGYISFRQSTGEMFYSSENSNGYHRFLTNDFQRVIINNNGLQVTGSISVTGSAILTLTPQNPLPSGVATGSFAVSSSIPAKPYFWDGSTWQALY